MYRRVPNSQQPGSSGGVSKGALAGAIVGTLFFLAVTGLPVTHA